MKPTKATKMRRAANRRRRHEHSKYRGHRALHGRYAHQSLDRGDQLRAARVVRARAVSSGALLVDQSIRRRTLDEDPASLHRVRHGRDVLPALREILAGQLYAAARLDVAAENQ